MDDFTELLKAHTEKEDLRFNYIEETLSRHVDRDYPEVVERLKTIEHLLHEIGGGMKVLRFIGWSLSAIAASFIFFKDHLFHLGK
jgi:hypothetical protein